jgi:uncharacterized protein YndB with AHSA1/START domain
MGTKTSAASPTAEREIVLSREFDAPRDLVWKAWTDPAQVGHWWGPNGFTITNHEMKVRPGGAWRLTMHGPDGTDYPNRMVYSEVVAPERLVYTHDSGQDDDPGQFHVVVTFAEQRGRTTVTMRSLFRTREARDFVVEKYHAIEGGRQHLARLAGHLATIAGGREFVITREFNAPRDLVWKAWTEPERLARWWGPRGYEMQVVALDLRPGGVFHYGMRSPDGKDLWGKFVYREIAAPSHLVFVVSFCDERGGMIRHWMSPTWPLEVLNTLALTEHEGRTTVTIRGVPINATPEEHRTFEGGITGMQRGFGLTFDQLDAYLTRA